MPGNSRSLWSAVKISKDTGTNDIPQNMSCDGVSVACSEVADAFARFFEEKVSKIVNSTQIDQTVYNGHQKMATIYCKYLFYTLL